MKHSTDSNKWYHLIDTLGNLILLNLLYVLFCVPLITIPAATVALYSCTLLLARRESFEISRFFRVFKQDFLIALKAGLFIFLIGVVLVFDYFMFKRIDAIPAFLANFVFVFLFLLFSVSLYVFPLIARFENNLWEYIRLSMAFSFKYFPQTILMMFPVAVPFVLYVINADIAVRLIIFWVLLGIALIAFLNSIIINRIFKRYEMIPPENDSNKQNN